jgi:hypothetical protein
MKIDQIYNLMEQRGLTNSQRHFSSVWLERGENYLSQNKGANISPADALTLWRSLQNEREYELAATLLADLLEGQS